MIELIRKIIDESSQLSQIQKNIARGFLNVADNERNIRRKDIELIQKIANEKIIADIILSTNEVKIYTTAGKDEWSIKYPFRIIYFKNNSWLNINEVSQSLDLAYLIYLQHKHIGLNSQFADFAAKMLEISK